MFQNAKRHELRALYAEVLSKMNEGQDLTALEQDIANVLSAHSEYHPLLKDLDKDFTPEMGQTNPYLHMSLHLSIREQVSLNRPAGITEVYDSLLKKYHDVHDVEHKMMDVLGEVLFNAQKNGVMPDENTYLETLSALLS